MLGEQALSTGTPTPGCPFTGLPLTQKSSCYSSPFFAESCPSLCLHNGSDRIFRVSVVRASLHTCREPREGNCHPEAWARAEVGGCVGQEPHRSLAAPGPLQKRAVSQTQEPRTDVHLGTRVWSHASPWQVLLPHSLKTFATLDPGDRRETCFSCLLSRSSNDNAFLSSRRASRRVPGWQHPLPMLAALTQQPPITAREPSAHCSWLHGAPRSGWTCPRLPADGCSGGFRPFANTSITRYCSFPRAPARPCFWEPWLLRPARAELTASRLSKPPLTCSSGLSGRSVRQASRGAASSLRAGGAADAEPENPKSLP